MRLHQHLPNAPGLAEAGCAVLADLVRQANLPPPVSFAVDHSLAEHLQNVRNYSGASAVELELETDGSHLKIMVSDDGQPFDPTAAPEPDLTLPIDQRPIGGLGIHMMRRFMDRLEYRREGDRNQLVMVKSLAATPAPATP